MVFLPHNPADTSPGSTFLRTKGYQRVHDSRDLGMPHHLVGTTECLPQPMSCGANRKRRASDEAWRCTASTPTPHAQCYPWVQGIESTRLIEAMLLHRKMASQTTQARTSRMTLPFLVRARPVAFLKRSTVDRIKCCRVPPVREQLNLSRYPRSQNLGSSWT